MADPLRAKLYAWENGFKLQVGKAPWQALREVHATACKLYNVPAITVIRAPRSADTSYFLSDKIYLKPEHRTLDVLLHETAHYISDYFLGPDRPHHDTYFMQVYFWLLLKFKVFTRTFLEASLKPYGLKVKPLSPSKIRK